MIPGYNIPDGASTNAPGGFRLRNAVQGATDRFIAAGGPQALRDKFSRPTPAPTPLQSAVNAAVPGSIEAAQAVKWAFRGNRTARTQSLYREQNIYGGVQRDLMPTERISVRKRGIPTQADRERASERTMLDYEELALPVAGGGGPQGGVQAATALPLPAFAGERPDPLSGMHRATGSSQDPLFLQNTQAGGVNPMTFDPHQRATTGIPLPGR
jgi:hypothetical protein